MAVTLVERDGRRRTARRIESYRREGVTFRNGGVVLAGTLRRPVGSGRRPAVILLHGSNRQTRSSQDGLLGFVADDLARRGIAALTYDKRGTGLSGGTYVDDNYDSLAADAAAGVAFLRSRADVDAERIGVWGVSQGGQLAPIVARRAGGVAFLVNLSGNTVNSNDQEIQRTGLKLGADGFPAEDVRAAVALQRLKFEYACGRTEEAWRSYAAALERARGAAWLPDPYIGPPESRESSAWDFWRCGVEPARYWESISAPALLIYGEHETYAEPGINIARFQRAMDRAGNRRFKVLRVPEAEHSMKLARTGGDRELLLLDRYQLDFFELQGAWLESQAEARP